MPAHSIHPDTDVNLTAACVAQSSHQQVDDGSGFQILLQHIPGVPIFISFHTPSLSRSIINSDSLRLPGPLSIALSIQSDLSWDWRNRRRRSSEEAVANHRPSEQRACVIACWHDHLHQCVRRRIGIGREHDNGTQAACMCVRWLSGGGLARRPFDSQCCRLPKGVRAGRAFAVLVPRQ